MKKENISKLTLKRESLRRLDADRLFNARGADGPKPTAGQVSINICTISPDTCA